MAIVKYTNGKIRYAKSIEYLTYKPIVKVFFYQVQKEDSECFYKYKLEVLVTLGRLFSTVWLNWDSFIELIDRPKYHRALCEIKTDKFNYLGTVEGFLWQYSNDQTK